MSNNTADPNTVHKLFSTSIGCLMLLTHYDGLQPLFNPETQNQLALALFKFLCDEAPWHRVAYEDVVDGAFETYSAHLREIQVETFSRVKQFLALDHLPLASKKSFLMTYLSDYQLPPPLSFSSTALIHDTVGVPQDGQDQTPNARPSWYSGRIIHDQMIYLHLKLENVSKQLKRCFSALANDPVSGKIFDMELFDGRVFSFRYRQPTFFGGPGTGNAPFWLWKNYDTIPENFVLFSILDLQDSIRYLRKQIVDNPSFLPAECDISPRSYGRELDHLGASATATYDERIRRFHQIRTQIESLPESVMQEHKQRVQWYFILVHKKVPTFPVGTQRFEDHPHPSPIPDTLWNKIREVVRHLRQNHIATVTPHTSEANFPRLTPSLDDAFTVEQQLEGAPGPSRYHWVHSQSAPPSVALPTAVPRQPTFTGIRNSKSDVSQLIQVPHVLVNESMAQNRAIAPPPLSQAPPGHGVLGAFYYDSSVTASRPSANIAVAAPNRWVDSESDSRGQPGDHSNRLAFASGSEAYPLANTTDHMEVMSSDDGPGYLVGNPYVPAVHQMQQIFHYEHDQTVDPTDSSEPIHTHHWPQTAGDAGVLSQFSTSSEPTYYTPGQNQSHDMAMHPPTVFHQLDHGILPHSPPTAPATSLAMISNSPPPQATVMNEPHRLRNDYIRKRAS
ncbi:hypothetical protein BJ165DRAFT_1528871 [Panaeolus papilionaceus]|nr:hypothetical protein BJ165DRAFT_1528871 [Panaeolus papilionaceus]